MPIAFSEVEPPTYLSGFVVIVDEPAFFSPAG